MGVGHRAREYFRIARGHKGGGRFAKHGTVGEALKSAASSLSSDPKVREVQVENRIRAAYAKALAAKGGPGKSDNRWVMLSDLRDQLGESTNRHEIDAALTRMGSGNYPHEGHYIVPESNQKALTPAMREAAVHFGGQHHHAISIADPSPRPVPKTAAAKLANPKPSPHNSVAEALGHKTTPIPRHSIGHSTTAGGSHISFALPHRSVRVDDEIHDPGNPRRTGRVLSIHSGQMRVAWSDGHTETRPVTSVPEPPKESRRSFPGTPGPQPPKMDAGLAGAPRKRSAREKMADHLAAGKVDSNAAARLMRGESAASIVDSRTPDGARERAAASTAAPKPKRLTGIEKITTEFKDLPQAVREGRISRNEAARIIRDGISRQRDSLATRGYRRGDPSWQGADTVSRSTRELDQAMQDNEKFLHEVEAMPSRRAPEASPARAKMAKASAPTVDHHVAALEKMTSREEATAYLGKVKGAELTALAKHYSASGTAGEKRIRIRNAVFAAEDFKSAQRNLTGGHAPTDAPSRAPVASRPAAAKMAKGAAKAPSAALRSSVGQVADHNPDTFDALAKLSPQELRRAANDANFSLPSAARSKSAIIKYLLTTANEHDSRTGQRSIQNLREKAEAIRG